LKNALIFSGNVQHTMLNVAFLIAGTTTGIEGAKVTTVELLKVGTSDILGNAVIEKFVGGTYHVTFEAEGYATQSQIVAIGTGEKVNMTVAMVGV